ncbi:hypothetical protein [Terribacillus sp. FSL K6-0262]|uniref:hypothetical protein n=1 Tax=Terribacillus sp. FSL K6-0262 TaxID=2921447 RepID=UPI0030ED6891
MRLSYRLQLAAIVISVIISLIMFRYSTLYNFKGYDKALEGILLISSISLGFYGACIGVLASIFNTKAIQGLMSEKGEKLEFIIITSLSLFIGFITVSFTIFFQVLLDNGNVSETILRWTNSIWSGVVINFICNQIIFVTISFMIFFFNKEENPKKDVFTPTLKTK